MTWEGTFTTEDELDFKAGANVSSTITQTHKNAIVKQIESTICNELRFDYVAEYSSLNNTKKLILSEITSNLGAIYMIQYDMSTFSTRIEAENMLVVLRSMAERAMNILRESKTNTYLQS